VRTGRPRSAGGRLIAVVLSAVVLVPGAAAAQEDGGERGPLFDSRDALIGGVYVAATGVGFALDRTLAAAIRDSTLQAYPGLRRAASGFNFLGFAGSIILSGGLYGVGRLGGIDEMADAGLHMGEAVLIAGAVTGSLKLLVGRARPDVAGEPYDFGFGRGFRGDPYQSFPSGHTTAAFATAAAAAHEIERIWGGNDLLIGLATYGPAVLVGVARMFDDRHWASDVVAGAAIGAFSGWKVVRYSHEGPRTRVDRWLLSVSLIPGDWGRTRVALVPFRP
jgi:membrane-associated phospholipid phosphatase